MRRATVVFCYIISGFGIIVSLLAAITGVINFIDEPLSSLWGVLIIIAWVCHFIMSYNWILGVRLGKRFSLCATAIAILALTLPSLLNLNFDSNIIKHAASFILFVLPCFLLALYLVYFHSKKRIRT